ncbi:NUDIX domain-containing protein [Maritalea sp.]|uniref:NUDIX domain-containing protein n=1 Tax=Maritalea sp. TaxID=2003361 RepID=UPI003EF9DE70
MPKITQMFMRVIHTPLFERYQSRVFLFIMGFWRRTTLGARAMLIDGKKVLLIKHTYTKGWLFPGGGVETGDSVLETAKRELFEETGYQVEGDGQFLSLYHNAEASRRDHVALFVFRDFEQGRPFEPNAEIAEMGWFSIDELPSDVSDATKNRIAEYFGGVAISQKW